MSFFPTASLYHAAIASTIVALVYLLASTIYAFWLHPLSRVPGPWYVKISSIPFWYVCITGRQVHWMHKLHTQYGPLVRYGVNELSYVDYDLTAWKAVHGHQKGAREFLKAKEWFVAPYNGVYGINSASSYEDHRRFRHAFAPAFSDHALKRQEPIFKRIIDLLVSSLSQASVLGQAVNIVEIYQYTTFDIMGYLTFGEPLGLLECNTYTKWVEAVFDSIKVIPIAQVIQYYPILNFLFKTFEPEFVKKMKYSHFKHSADRVDRRLKRGSLDTDIWSMVVNASSHKKLTLDELHCHGDVFMLAGSETTGTTLASLTYYLLTNEDKLAVLVKEIRAAFTSECEISFRSVGELTYLQACIKEALRLFPPVPVGVPRVVPDTLSGQRLPHAPVPAGTRVSVHHYATYHSPRNFREPESFLPERWLGDPLYEGDNRECFRPFAIGPRDCLGQNMAMYEMQLVMAKLLYKFNIEAYDERQLRKWDQAKAFVLWEKKPLMCRFRLAA